MKHTQRRLAAFILAILVVWFTAGFPARATETYTITLYGNGGYCIDASGSKLDSLSLDISEGTVLTADETCGDVIWQHENTLLGFAGWQDAEGVVYDAQTPYTVTKDAELYAVWSSLIDDPIPEPDTPSPVQTEYTIMINGGNNGYYLDQDSINQTNLVLTVPADSVLALNDHLGSVSWKNTDFRKYLSGWTLSSGDYLASTTEYAVTQNVTLTAVWEDWYLITFTSGSDTASFDIDGAVSSSVTIQHPAGADLTHVTGQLVNTDSTKALSGWDYDGDGIKDLDDYYGYRPTSDTTFSAVWATVSEESNAPQEENNSSTDLPVTEESRGTDDSVADESTSDESNTNNPTGDEPAIHESTVDESANDESTESKQEPAAGSESDQDSGQDEVLNNSDTENSAAENSSTENSGAEASRVEASGNDTSEAWNPRSTGEQAQDSRDIQTNTEESAVAESIEDESDAQDSSALESKAESSKADAVKPAESKTENSNAEEHRLEDSGTAESIPFPADSTQAGSAARFPWGIVIGVPGAALIVLAVLLLRKRKK